MNNFRSILKYNQCIINGLFRNYNCSNKRYYCIKKCSIDKPKDYAKYLYSNEVENQINIQITNELTASHLYLSMASFFGKSSVAMLGCAGFFLQMSDEEHEHAIKLINYQNKRGGTVELHQIVKPQRNESINVFDALHTALDLEYANTADILKLYKLAEQFDDIITMDFLSTEYFPEQMTSIQFFGRIISRFTAANVDGCGSYQMDKELGKKYPYKGKFGIQ